MGTMREGDVQEDMKRKSKKRKKRESSALRGADGDIQISNKVLKKKKMETVGDINAFEVVADVDHNLGVHNSSKQEKKERGKNRINEKDELRDSQREKKKKKNKIGDEGGASQAEDVFDKVEPIEYRKRKKKKMKKKAEDGVSGGISAGASETNVHSISNGEQSGSRGHKRKKEKSIRSTSGGISAGDSETNEGNGAIDHAGAVENQMESRIIDEVESVKGKKRKKKKKDDLGAGSVDKELFNKTNLPSSSSGESSGDRGSKRETKFIVSNIKGDAIADALKSNKRNNPIEPVERSAPSVKLKKVRFSNQVEFLSLADNSRGIEKLKGHSNGKKKVDRLKRRMWPSQEKNQIVRNSVVNNREDHQTKKVDDGLIRGKCFTKEEDEIVKKSVLNFIEKHQLGEKGLEMVLKCRFYPEVRDCWREIGQGLPSRPHMSVYHRAHVLFERSESHSWTPEEIELVKNFHEKNGPDWRALADELGKLRFHVKDTWRKIRHTNIKKGRWSQDECQALFDLVNTDLRMKAFQEKKSKHGMLRDNISWEAISERLSPRSNALCCQKWYDQLTSPMVAEGKWADVDDYRLLIALDELDAACQEDVDWDNLLEHRSGDVCRKRWNQMVRNIGEHGTKSFADQVEILSKRYCLDVLGAREAYDSKPAVD